MARPSHPATIAVLIPLLAGCAIRPSEADHDNPIIMVESVRLPVRDWLPWFARFAEHTWIDFQVSGSWYRIEWDSVDHIILQDMAPGEVFEDVRWERDVAVHQQWHGEWAKEAAENIFTVGESYPHAKQYLPWPGPNSNSLIEWLAQEVDLPLVMPPAALGKDYTTWLHAGITSSNTGLELETTLLGAQVGLREGVELHVLGLTLGVGIWPPTIKLPFLPAIPGGWFAP